MHLYNLRIRLGFYAANQVGIARGASVENVGTIFTVES